MFLSLSYMIQNIRVHFFHLCLCLHLLNLRFQFVNTFPTEIFSLDLKDFQSLC